MCVINRVKEICHLRLQKDSWIQIYLKYKCKEMLQVNPRKTLGLAMSFY